MQAESVKALVLHELDESKAREVSLLDVKALTSIADYLVICTATSTRHGKAIAHYVVEKAKAAGVMPLGVEGEREGEWILVDLGDVIVHVMLRETRDYYQLEKLWQADWAEQPAIQPDRQLNQQH